VTTITISFVALIHDGTDARQVALRGWPSVPRAGDSVQLEGPEFGERHGDGFQLFRVHSVTWGNDGDPEVMLEDPEPQGISLWCTCTAEEIARAEADHDGRQNERICPNCGDKRRPR